MFIIFFLYSNQSARELSHFAESAMAVKRVILQHFSMRYDYMTLERPNIYQPSSDLETDNNIVKNDLSTSSSSSMHMQTQGGSKATTNLIKLNNENKENKQLAVPNKQKIMDGCSNGKNNSTLDSIMEIKEKIPDDISLVQNIKNNCDDNEKKDSNNRKLINNMKKNLDSQVPLEENWRYKSSSRSADRYPLSFKNYRNFHQNHHFNNNNNSFNHFNNNNNNNNNKQQQQRQQEPQQQQQQQQQYDYSNEAAGIEIRNWRNESNFNATQRNCGMMAAAECNGLNIAQSNSADNDINLLGLSPPSESLLMQRRLRMSQRASNIELRSQQPATASG